MTNMINALRLANALRNIAADTSLSDRYCEVLSDADDELRRFARVEEQRDALLETLREIGKYTGEGSTHSTPWQDIVADLGQKARAAIKAVEQ